MESIMVAGIPAELHDNVVRNFRLAMAAKYILRCGYKDEPTKELDKASNYLHRARTGEFAK